MKLLTLNCHSWQEENQLDKIRTIASGITEKRYDVIALQEVSQLQSEPLVQGQVRRNNFVLALLQELEKLGETSYSYTWDYAHLGFEVYEEGLAILTRHPIKDKKSFFVSKGQDTNYWKTRKIVGSTIEIKGKPIHFYSCHLGWWMDEEEPFQYQADRLFELVNNDGLYFLLGDFNNNANLRGEGYDYLVKQGLFDTYQLARSKDDGVTVKGKIAGWDHNKQDLRLDLILANQAVKVSESKVIFNGTNYPVVSDHYGVEVVIDL
ncbi:endonuclease/exonuclease/phosphatase family protein [Peribacillus acanthi]|uniref:endonuclease/exonuclease/phosphatase family protein n=1 Tax=Peribacillus acanthi TaxID=2171554 RepID=UPI000D3E3CC7|nr:endonuclease/exonuclease/phosphatase family protein [Peribacillus acanthi]